MTDNTRVATLRVCKVCGRSFPLGLAKCPEDGGELVRQEKDHLLGTIFLGKYEVLSVLGKGGMSVVYKTRHVHMEKILALKLLNQELTNDEVARERFRREASAASSLSHQNVVVVHDFGFTEAEPKQAYLVMDCLEGSSLSDLIESQGTIPLSRAIEVFKQGLDGLEHAHKKGIIHRDIKPSNLVVIPEDDGTDLVKLVDFGIAKAAPQEGEKQRQQLTQTGEIFGSPLYMSPEQCNGRGMDPRSDIYSFGCLMYETVAGIPPLIGDTYINTVVKHLQEQPPPFSKTAPQSQIPAALEAVIMKCLEKDPDRRYGSVAELRQALLDAALASGIKGYRAGAVPEVPRGPSNLAMTFDRVKLALTGGSTTCTKQKGNPLIPIISVLGIAGIALWLFTVPIGVEGVDRVSALDRILFANLLKELSDDLGKGKIQDAKKVGSQAEKMARRFDDAGDRLEKALRAEWRVALAMGDSTEQERLRHEISESVTNSIRRDYEAIQQHLSKLEIPLTSSDDRTKRQAEVKGTGSAARDIAVRLHSRDLHREEEQLLQQAMRVYEGTGLGGDAKVAELKTQLAKCYSDLQRYDESLILYRDAASIRKNIGCATPENKKALSKALFNLGTFERDQSHFTESEKHLEEAIKLAEEDGKDQKLLLDDLRGYADLLKQMRNANHTEVTDSEKQILEKIGKLEKELGSSPKQQDQAADDLSGP